MCAAVRLPLTLSVRFVGWRPFEDNHLNITTAMRRGRSQAITTDVR